MKTRTNEIRRGWSLRKIAPHRPTIGLLSDDFFFHVPIALLHGVEAMACQHDLNLIYVASNALQAPQDFQIQSNILYDIISADNVDALLLCTNLITGTVSLEELMLFCGRYHPLPLVSLGGILDGVPSVVLDNTQGMYAAVSHLIDAHGLRRIAFITGPPNHADAQERYQAYVQALADHGLSLDPKLVLPGDFLSPSGQEAIRLLLDERRRQPGRDVDAIVAANDHMALTALLELQSRQIRVPEDLALVGFDNNPATRTLTPPLTTVEASFEEVGRKGVELLLAHMVGKPVPAVSSVPARLRVRQSCGCAPQQERLTGEMRSLPEPLSSMLVTDPKEALLRLNQELQAPRDIAIWEHAFAILRQYAPILHATSAETADPSAEMTRAVWSALIRTAYLTFKDNQYTLLKEQIEHALISTVDLGEITNILAIRLPQLGICHGYLALYEDPLPFIHPQTLPEWSRLHLAYTAERRIDLPPDGLRFRSRQMLPRAVLPQQGRYTLLTIALYFQQEQIGFLVVDSGAPDERVYLDLQSQISSALQGVLLVRRAQARSAEVIRQNYILDTFMANVPDSIYFKDRVSAFTRVNNALANLFGLDHPSAAIGKTDFDFFPEEQARLKYEQEQTIIRTGQPVLALEEPDAQGQWALTTKMPLRDEHDNIIGTFGISRNITALKQTQAALEQAYADVEQRVTERTAELQQEIAQRIRAEDALRTLNAELEQRVTERTANLEAANKELQNFAYVVSHDLKAPLRGIAHLAQWLAEDYGDQFHGEGRNMLTLLVNRVKRLDDLIEGILQYSRIGRTDTEEDMVDLALLVHAVIENLSIPAHIQVTVAAEFPVVRYNRTRMTQVFQNLISNAVKFLDKPQGKITIDCEDQGSTWLFRIADNGPGIDARYHHRIFKVFQTLVPRDQRESTGIGLALVKKIVELYGGRVGVESTVGTGSTFFFTLPKT